MRRGIYIIPSLFTLGNLAAGVLSILLATNDRLDLAAWAILVGIVMDMLDGRVARWTGATSEFGMELDSLCDLVTFGVAPAILMYNLALEPLGRVGYAIAVFFPVAGALRSLGHDVSELDPKEPGWRLAPGTEVVFLALHGTYGEDGTVQSELEKLRVPYTGCDSAASRIGFDKALTKQRCAAAGVPTARSLVLESAKTPWPMGWNPPLVLKPVRQGSSVGLQFVERVEQWAGALAESLRHDSEVLMEEKIVGRECTV